MHGVLMALWLFAGQGAGSLEPAMGAIFPQETAPVFVTPCAREDPRLVRGFWTPSADDVARVDAALGKVLQQEIDKRTVGQPALDARDFYRQYVGLVIAAEKVVYVNGFHRAAIDPAFARVTAETWRHEPLDSCGANVRFFGAEFVVSSGVLRHIKFNSDPRLGP